MEEVTTFCARYVDGMETKLNRPVRYEEGPIGAGTSFLMTANESYQAHRFILFNNKNVMPYIDEQKTALKHQHLQWSENRLQLEQHNVFVQWFREHVEPNCMLGEGSQLGDKCSVKRSVIGGHCRIGSIVKVVQVVVAISITCRVSQILIVVTNQVRGLRDDGVVCYLFEDKQWIKDTDDVVTSSRSSKISNPSMQNDNYIHHKEARKQCF
ncbi:hypothetical protein H6P81_016367 [Aristolochia fimbriata]|uniref:Uncharacterized protein n=1 Tax=Aristolochia fimbriata TaxID=158543 RepID=A0AAV7E861_ARIFI|nr:hypothetical protein H6P81_016367 [Aristolochia fimbriata]